MARASPGRARAVHFKTIPACESEKETKTPIMYSGMSAWVSPWKAATSTAANPLRTMMPLEKASRSPWFMNCRGRKPSRAMIEARRGKSW